MQEIKKYDIDIDFCPSCKGVWLDRGEIDKIAKVQNGYEEEHYQKYLMEKEIMMMTTMMITIIEGEEREGDS